MLLDVAILTLLDSLSHVTRARGTDVRPLAAVWHPPVSLRREVFEAERGLSTASVGCQSNVLGGVLSLSNPLFGRNASLWHGGLTSARSLSILFGPVSTDTMTNSFPTCPLS